MARRNRRALVSAAQPQLNQLKFEIAQELGYSSSALSNESSFEQYLDGYKYSIASELGLHNKVQQVGWENMTSGECGAIGGRIGGQLGGQMVRRLIEIAESSMTSR